MNKVKQYKAENELVLGYKAGSKERNNVEKTYNDMFNSKVDVPLYIGEKEILTEKRKNILPPHDHKNIVGTWWNHEIIQAKAQISGISGRIIEQTVTFLGKEEIKIGNKTYKTLHFNFKSSDETLPDSKKLNTDIWYEEETYLWVKAAFEKTGYWEYRIKKAN